MANAALVVRSNGALSSSNLHFVVHQGATLTFEATRAITLDRDEMSTLPLIVASGEVSFKAGGWVASYGEGSTEDRGDVIRVTKDGKLSCQHAVRFTPNSVIAADAVAMPRKDDQGTELEKILPRDGNTTFKEYYYAAKAKNSNKYILSDKQALDAKVQATLHPSGDGTPLPTPTPNTATTSSGRNRGKTGKPRYLEALEATPLDDRKAIFDKTYALVMARNNNETDLAEKHPADAKLPLNPPGGETTPPTPTTTPISVDHGRSRAGKPLSTALAGPGWWRRLPPPTAPTQDYDTPSSLSPRSGSPGSPEEKRSAHDYDDTHTRNGAPGNPERKRSARDGDDDEGAYGSNEKPFPSGDDGPQEELLPSGGDGSHEKSFRSGSYSSEKEPFPPDGDGSHEEPFPLVAVLKVGDTLRGKLRSADGLSAVWPDVDGSILFGRYVLPDLDEHGIEEEDSGKTPSSRDEGEEYSKNTPSDWEEDKYSGNIPNDREEGGKHYGEIPSDREEEMEDSGKIPSERREGKEGSKNVPGYRQVAGEDSVNFLKTTLVRSNFADVQRVLKLRRMMMKELKELIEDTKEEGGSGEKGMGKDDAWGWLPWRQRAERELERSRRCLGKVDMMIDDRACVEVTVDGIPVVSKSGMFQWEVLNRFPWRWPKDDGYELHVVGDGIEVQLGGKAVWDFRLEDVMG